MLALWAIKPLNCTLCLTVTQMLMVITVHIIYMITKKAQTSWALLLLFSSITDQIAALYIKRVTAPVIVTTGTTIELYSQLQFLGCV